MAKSDWIKERDNAENIVWRNRHQNNVTIEAHTYDEDQESPLMWYIYGAVDRNGVPNAPSMVEKKSDAIRIIASLKKSYKNNGIRGFER